MGYVAMSDEIYENSVFKPLLWLFVTFLNGGKMYTFVRCIQGCAPAEPGTRKSQNFFIQIIRFYSFSALGSLQFSLEHSLVY